MRIVDANSDSKIKENNRINHQTEILENIFTHRSHKDIKRKEIMAHITSQ